MTEELAAQAEEEVIDDPRLDKVETEPEAKPDSAPDDAKTDDKPEDGFQKRINKVTADKYAEKRRADALEQKVKELEGKLPSAVPKEAPKLEDFGHDEIAYQAALIDYRVEQKVQESVQSITKSQSDAQKAKEAEEAQKAFNDRIVALGKEDFDIVANRVPLLPEGVADALVKSANGAELIYHLGTHLDQADKIANMTPQMAMMELGTISASMAATQKVKPSAAPDPIEPVSSSGSISTERGPKGATYE